MPLLSVPLPNRMNQYQQVSLLARTLWWVIVWLTCKCGPVSRQWLHWQWQHCYHCSRAVPLKSLSNAMSQYQQYSLLTRSLWWMIFLTDTQVWASHWERLNWQWHHCYHCSYAAPLHVRASDKSNEPVLASFPASKTFWWVISLTDMQVWSS